jgi:hypothetical protein
MSERRIVARFTTTPEEMIEAVKVLSGVLYGFSGLSPSAGLWRRAMLFGIGGVIGLGILTVGNAIAAIPGGFTPRDYIIAVIAAVVSALVVLVGLGQFQMRRMRAALFQQLAHQEVEIVADASGLWWNTASEKHFWLYSKFERLIPFKEGYYLVTGLSGGYIPGRGFASDDEKAAFEQLIRDNLRPEVIARFFAAKDVRSG